MEYDIPYPTYIPYIGPNNAPLGVKCQGRVVTCFSLYDWVHYVYCFFFPLRYSAQYLGVLTLVCYIAPYIFFVSVEVQMPPFWALQSMRAHGAVL